MALSAEILWTMTEKVTAFKLPTWREMHSDTTPEAEALIFAYWREAPGWEKWQRMVELNRSARLLALVGLRQRHPEASEEELRRRLADLLLGPELAARVYGSYPGEAPGAG